MADVAGDLKSWSTTAASNSPAGGTAVGTGLDDNLREIQKVVRQDLATKGADIASATTTDIGAVAGKTHTITGTTTITGLGTVSAGIEKTLIFDGALVLTHNATSLILPGAANITTAQGDVGEFVSLGSGNWRCLSFEKADGTHLGMVLGTNQATTSGTSFSYTGIPTGTKKITISFAGVTLDNTDDILVQIGDSGGVENTGYVSSSGAIVNGGATVVRSSTAGFIIQVGSGTNSYSGQMILTLLDASTFQWSSIHLGKTSTIVTVSGGGDKSLSAELTQLQIVRSATGNFDNGSLNIIYER